MTSRKRKPSEAEAVAEALAEALDSTFLRALAEPVRIDIIKHLILHGESDIASIASSVAPDRSVVSRHLRLMLDAGLVTLRKEGRHRFYDCNAAALIRQLEDILGRTRELVALCCPASLPATARAASPAR